MFSQLSESIERLDESNLLLSESIDHPSESNLSLCESILRPLESIPSQFESKLHLSSSESSFLLSESISHPSESNLPLSESILHPLESIPSLFKRKLHHQKEPPVINTGGTFNYANTNDSFAISSFIINSFKRCLARNSLDFTVPIETFITSAISISEN